MALLIISTFICTHQKGNMAFKPAFKKFVRLTPESKKKFVPTPLEQQVMDYENAKKKGYDPKKDMWSAIKSPEGGYEIGYGQNKIGGREVQPTDSMSGRDVSRDLRGRLNGGREQLMKDPSIAQLPDEAVDQIVSLQDNIGPAALDNSKAMAALRGGDADSFVQEAFDQQKGFTKAGGEVLPGLVKRRAEEGRRFTGAMIRSAKYEPKPRTTKISIAGMEVADNKEDGSI